MDFLNVKRVKFHDENVITDTSIEQRKVEESVERLFHAYIEKAEIDPDAPILLIKEHTQFLKQCISYLPATYTCLDSSRPWMCYWICHSLALLNYNLDDSLKSHIAKFLDKCQCPEGGFGGGPGQAAHLASTYAAVNALCCLSTDEAFEVINRKKLKDFLWMTKCPSGAFCLEVGGEVDIRGTYCAAAVATITNLDTNQLFDTTARWILGCQTYEGGFSGYPGLEAHGGYTFCGIAALALLNSIYLCDLKALLRWCVNRQTSFEGGFQGRTNKLVDGCYSFWQGSIFPIIYSVLNNQNDQNIKVNEHLFNHKALQEYILICCQHPYGGLIDKPSKPRDIYHTCYTLSGLSVAQHPPNEKPDIIGFEENLLYMNKKDNFYHTDAVAPDVIFHSKHANSWWDKKTLIGFNDVRVPFIRDALSCHQGAKRNGSDDDVGIHNLSVLDVGCGGGILAESLARLRACVTGIDPSASLIDVARKHATYDNQLDNYLRYEASSIHDFCIPNVDKFDAVVISEVLEHIDEKENFLQSCLKCLKAQGSLIVTTPNKTLLSKIFVVNLAERFGIIPSGTHDFDKFISREELKSLLKKYGCTVKESQGFKYNPLNRKFSYSNFEALMYALHALKLPH